MIPKAAVLLEALLEPVKPKRRQEN